MDHEMGRGWGGRDGLKVYLLCELSRLIEMNVHDIMSI